MESVALRARPARPANGVEVEQARLGRARQEAPLRFDVPTGNDLRLIGRGPALFAEDQRVLEAFAAAAQTAYDGRRLSAKAREAASSRSADRQRTALLAGVGHDLRTPLAGIKASVEHAQAERRRVVRRASETSCWRRSRSPRTGSTRSSPTCSTRAGSRRAR